MSVAIYCRVASRSQLDAGVIENLRRELLNVAKLHGYTVCSEYLDNGYSGLTLDRPALARLESDIKAGAIDTVIIRSVDRVARDLILCNNWIKEMERRGVKIVAVDGFLESFMFTSDVLHEIMKSKSRLKCNRDKKE